jgi:hypothetical protein
MHCRKCGHVLSGKYCVNCGCPIELQSLGDYELISHLLQDSRVESLLGPNATQSSGGMSGDDVLKTADRIISVTLDISSVVPLDISAKIGHALWSALGVKSTSTDSAPIHTRFAYVAIASLCYLRRNSMSIISMSEKQSTAVLQAKVAGSFLWTGEGRCHVVMQNRNSHVDVAAAVEFPGQGFDWGRGSKLVAEFLSHVNRMATELSLKRL